ncbi:MAG: peptidylprolyl isomerase [Acidobacteria bacterium]|nr:MAG: peptidylprolyl isomerase [Acidobacteriota bacterium]
MRTRYLLCVIFSALIWSIGCGSSEQKETRAPAQKETVKAPEPAKPQGQPHAVLETDKGAIVIRLLPDLAPRTVENFEKLINAGFYYKTKFHRVMAGKMIQGGDPNTKDNDPYNDGQGNTGNYLSAEFSSRKFERGVVAMAHHEGDPDSASSQFFVVLQRMPNWDGQYTIFGEVTEGLDVADKISKAPLSKNPRLRNWPVENIRIQSARVEYK